MIFVMLAELDKDQFSGAHWVHSFHVFLSSRFLLTIPVLLWRVSFDTLFFDEVCIE